MTQQKREAFGGGERLHAEVGPLEGLRIAEPRLHGEAFGAEGTRGGEIPFGIPHHHDPARPKGVTQPGRPALGPDAKQLGALLGVAAEAAEGEAVGQAGRFELQARARLDVPGAQANCEALGRLEMGQQRMHTGMYPIAFGTPEFLREPLEVETEHFGDGCLVVGTAGGAQSGADDRPVGHASEGEFPAGIAAPAEGGEGRLHGAAPGPTGRDEGAIDVEENDGGPHLSPAPLSTRMP